MPRSGGEGYGGAPGRTRTERIQFSCSCGLIYGVEVHASVNARDAAVAARLVGGTLGRVTCPSCATVATAEVPVVYHDEERRILVLVLPPAMRHRELEERARLLLAMAEDKVAPVPAYARGFAVVFGAPALVAFLAEGQARPAAGPDPVRLAAQEIALGQRDKDLAARGAELDAQRDALAARRAELDQYAANLAARSAELDMTDPGKSRGGAGKVATLGADDGETGPFARLEPDELTPPQSEPPRPGPDDVVPPAPAVRDAALERWIVSRAPTLHLVDKGQVRLCATLAPARLEPLLGGALSARVQLHRTQQAPLVVVAVARDGADGAEPLAFHLDPMRIDDRGVLGALGLTFSFSLDLYDADHLPVAQRRLEAPLAENVRYVVSAAEEHLAGIPTGQRSFEAALAAWRAPGFDRWGRTDPDLEEDSFGLLPTPGTTRMALGIIAFWNEPENEDYLILVRSFPLGWWRRIRSRVLARSVDFGLSLPPGMMQLALGEGLARSRKELVHKLVHAFGDVAAGLKPNDLDPEAVRENWRLLVAEAEALGVPLEGKAGDLAAIAVGAIPPSAGEGGTGVRIRGLAAPVPTGRITQRMTAVKSEFSDVTVRIPTPVPPMESAAAPARKPSTVPPAARPAAAAKGVVTASGKTPAPAVVAPDTRPRHNSPIVAGEIHASGGPLRRDYGKAPVEELLGLLDDKDLRRDAAVELCRRGEPAGVGPVFGALRRMTRGEAVRVLPAVVRFGERAVPHLVDGLRSRKGFLRQGCALALGVLKSAEGIESLCDLLLSEPTDVWREVARAVGEIGAGAVMSLAARLREVERGGRPPSDSEPGQPAPRDRIAWALAHVAARGGRTQVETLAEGRDTGVAAAAKRALDLTGTAKDNDAEVRSQNGTPRDQTVNRAFSRRFFEALSGRAPRALGKLEADGRSGEDEELSLDDGDILDGDEEVLDDEDLIPG